MGRLRFLAAVLLAAAALLVRGPLHLATFALPVSNDDAILLLMGRHLLRGELSTTLWNQPYNGALDAYLLAPLLAVLPHHGAYRLYQAVCAGLLVVLAGLLGRRLAGPAAGWAAALLAACGTPYMAVMTATGPPPNFLMPLVTGFPLLAALRARERPPGRPAVLGWGLVCGLAVWNSSLAIPALAGIGLGLALAGWRPRLAPALVFGAGFAAGAAPLLIARVIGASGSAVVTAASAVTAIRPRWLWARGLQELGHALVGIVGLQVPLVVDGAERALLPLALAGALAVGLVVVLALGAAHRRSLPLVGWLLALCGAFWLSRRTGPDELRYLYGLNVPLLVLAGCGLAIVWNWRRAAAVGLGLLLLVPWGWGERLQAVVWRDPAHAERVWQVPPLGPVVAALDAVGVRSAYASLQIAGRLALETRGRVIVSQSWNERIPGDPLRFRDEVDLDPAPAYVLSRRLSRGMPRAGGFRDLLSNLGGAFEAREVGGFVVFEAFRPPYDERRPVPPAGMSLATTAGTPLSSDVLDRDPATSWTSPVGIGRGSGLVVRVQPARRLSALVLLVDLERSPLAVPWTATIGGDVVSQGPARGGFQWVNGAPRAGKQALFVVPLGGRSAEEVRLVFQGPGPQLVVGEAFLYGPDEPALPEGGREAASSAYDAARAGRWDDAVAAYARAIRAEPQRASFHAAWARARWRARGRRWLDVESLDDGGPELVERR